ncbi:MAG: lipid A export permease/ATP-binding protein MsbA [Deltaproteobacteria bacterium]|nr:lipid A export permease/ATP-binding protein MsbA [Deltaproteobacteria bacterium]
MTTTQRLIQLIKPYWVRLLAAMGCMLMVAGATSLMPFMVKPVLDDIFIEKNAAILSFLPLLIILLFLVKGFFAFGQSYLMSFVGEKIVAGLREGLYAHLQKLSLSYFDRTATGLLMSRIINDVNLIQGAVSSAVTGILKDLFTLLGLIGVIFYRDWQLAILALLVFPIAVIPIVKFGRKLRKISTQSQRTMADISIHLHETLTGNRIVKAFNTEEYEIERFRQRVRKFFQLTMKDVSIKSMSSPIMEFLGGIGIAAIIGYGGYQVINGTSTTGTFFSFLTALLMLYEPIKHLSGVNNTIQQGMAAAIRVFEILDLPAEMRDQEGAVSINGIRQGIRFRNVSFGYGEQWVLRDINFEVKVGEIVAIVGTSGGGKTTLVNLIPRFYEASEGEILIDHRSIKTITQASLRRQIGLVTQQTILFNDTVRNNIAYGSPEKTEADILQAAQAAYAYDFVQRLPEKMDTLIGEQGMRLSGGERQRISIARALLKDAPILILDEATSSLDSESEAEVQRALENLMKGRTTFIIAHRFSTIRNVDRILVLAEGRIIEEGNHDRLMALNGEYKRLYEIQFRDNETKNAE